MLEEFEEVEDEEEVDDEVAHGTKISWGSINGTSSMQKPLVSCSIASNGLVMLLYSSLASVMDNDCNDDVSGSLL